MLFDINPYAHQPFLEQELQPFLVPGTFAHFMWQEIGQHLYYRAMYETDDDGYAEAFPVRALYNDIRSGWTLDPEWVQDNDGYVRDDGQRLPEGIEPKITPIDHFVCYALYLIRWLPNLGGDVPAEGEAYNEFGNTELDIVQHRAELMLLAYQALAFIHKIQLGEKIAPTSDHARKEYHAAISRKGAEAANQENRRLKKEAYLYWSANIDPKTSNDEAAVILAKQIPLRQRTLSRYVAEFKKGEYRPPADGTPS